jgi:hypothetical protein
VPIVKKLKIIIDFPTPSHQDEFNSSDEGTMIKEEVTKQWKAMAIKIRNVVGLVVCLMQS